MIFIPFTTNLLHNGVRTKHIISMNSIWDENWYPIYLAKNLDPDRPSAHTILNKHIVLWRDKNNNWYASDDCCPHKGAPLSSGYILKNKIVCSYHGWQFSKNGHLIYDPQSGSRTKCRIKTYPVHLCERGILWIWYSKTQSQPRPSVPSKAYRSQKNIIGSWTLYRLPVEFLQSVDNFMDVTHGLHTHTPRHISSQVQPLAKFKSAELNHTIWSYVKDHNNDTSFFRYTFPSRLRLSFNNSMFIEAFVVPSSSHETLIISALFAKKVNLFYKMIKLIIPYFNAIQHRIGTHIAIQDIRVMGSWNSKWLVKNYETTSAKLKKKILNNPPIPIVNDRAHPSRRIIDPMDIHVSECNECKQFLNHFQIYRNMCIVLALYFKSIPIIIAALMLHYAKSTFTYYGNQYGKHVSLHVRNHAF